jgi:hypothetical protein
MLYALTRYDDNVRLGMENNGVPGNGRAMRLDHFPLCSGRFGSIVSQLLKQDFRQAQIKIFRATVFPRQQ